MRGQAVVGGIDQNLRRLQLGAGAAQYQPQAQRQGFDLPQSAQGLGFVVERVLQLALQASLGQAGDGGKQFLKRHF